MPRKPRMYMGGMPCHVIQRGNNRNACFYSKSDYQFYLNHLGKACRRYGVKLHAYVLMTNHTHILITPDDESGISRVMQSLGRCYVQYINKTHGRTGTLWEGRHKGSLVDGDNYLLACHRYIELNPVRAGMVDRPEEYCWSSFRSNAYGDINKWLTPHDLYLALGESTNLRLERYRSLFDSKLDKTLVEEIRRAAGFSMPLGGSLFQVRIEKVLGRKLGYASRGRPRHSLGKCK